jgi:hypothetical protein
VLPGVLRNSESYINAALWFESHFYNYGDSEPTVSEVHLELCDKIDIYNTYKNEILVTHGNPDGVLSLAKWLEVWATCFSFVKIRVYKQVNGKCWTCYYINDGRQKATSRAALETFKKLHLMHKAGLYCLERIAYKRRRDYALLPENSDRVCSIIIDGMDQNHSLIPQLGPDVSVTSAIPQHITGILHHTNSSHGPDSGKSGSKYAARSGCASFFSLIYTFRFLCMNLICRSVSISKSSACNQRSKSDNSLPGFSPQRMA